MIDRFLPLTDAKPVHDLWMRSLGSNYPISERVFGQNIHGNPHYESGDGLVVRQDNKVIGFCLTRIRRTASRKDTPREGGIVALLIDPVHQRQGLGAKMLEHAEMLLQRQGITSLTAGACGLYRLWPGIPTDLEGAHAFFASHGYEMERGVFDLVRNLRDYTQPQSVVDTIQRESVRIEPASEDDVAPLLAFERREFSGWEAGMRVMCAAGDTDHIILVRDHGRIIGSLQTFSPASRFRAVNVAWEMLLGEDMGGMAAVGVAESHRGRGLGLALCGVASEILKSRGVGQCHIDWTSLVDFYGRLGYNPWREYWMASKKLEPSATATTSA